jgi:hypothetical protein
MKTITQTTRIVIDIPARAEGAPPLPAVTATRSTVLLDDSGAVVGKVEGGDETKMLDVLSNPSFGQVHAALAAAIDEAFTPPPPAPEPETDPDPTVETPTEPEPAP